VPVRDAAKRLGISERTLWALTDAGEIPVVRIGRRVLYDLADLHEFIERAKTKCAAHSSMK
jgi:excisionase family DNA binding protein